MPLKLNAVFNTADYEDFSGNFIDQEGEFILEFVDMNKNISKKDKKTLLVEFKAVSPQNQKGKILREYLNIYSDNDDHRKMASKILATMIRALEGKDIPFQDSRTLVGKKMIADVVLEKSTFEGKEYSNPRSRNWRATSSDETPIQKVDSSKPTDDSDEIPFD